MSNQSSPPDRRNDPNRSGLPLKWQYRGTDNGYIGQSPLMRNGGPEDERGFAEVEDHPSGGYSFNAGHYDPTQRSYHDPDDGWTNKQGSFVVQSPNRAMMAGQALLNRMQREANY